tara:strand:- start:44 stop:274 length:231 start_codon:yes stop_codon:yes gene_type:complete
MTTVKQIDAEDFQSQLDLIGEDLVEAQSHIATLMDAIYAQRYPQRLGRGEIMRTLITVRRTIKTLEDALGNAPQFI